MITQYLGTVLMTALLTGAALTMLGKGKAAGRLVAAIVIIGVAASLAPKVEVIMRGIGVVASVVFLLVLIYLGVVLLERIARRRLLESRRQTGRPSTSIKHRVERE